MNMNQQQTQIIRKGKLSILCVSIVLNLLVTTPALAATVSITSPATQPVIGHAPELKGGTVKASDDNGDGILGLGDSLKASDFIFSDEDGDKQTSILYEWYEDDNIINGTTGDTLKLTAALLGKTITVKAVASTDPAITEPSKSLSVPATTYRDIKNNAISGGKGITTIEGNIAKSVSISGISGTQPLVGEKLKANTVCYATCDNSLVYQWQIEDAVSSGRYTNIMNATTSEYTIKGTDQKRKIQVIVSNP
ncbi:ZirU family protein [Providencia manganoxydans]|uniref:ZirU family protein n=1 Tax=Providencia manganoxydans TaxID=2923283 RepID=UPI0032DA10A4